MMTELVTPEAAKMHLRIDDSEGEADLLLKIQGSSAAFLAAGGAPSDGER